jgi:protein-tyrosine phosphatase
LIPTLTGADNFRSLQGVRMRDGRHIAGHTLLRSDQLHRLDDNDWAVLRHIGLKTVCDLRSPSERQHYPNRLPEHTPRQLHFNVADDVRGDPVFSRMLADHPNATGAEQMMFEIYRRLPAALAGHLPTLFGLLEDDEVPLLIHCAAGKDRTGFVAAVLLHALGASPETILDDYLLTARSPLLTDPVKRSRIEASVSLMIHGACSEGMIDAILGVRESYLQCAYNALNEQYGSLDGYLASAGLDAPRLARLRDRYLSDA